ncbi:MAG: hypothetical protein AAFX85_16255 [Pseudomonadota bacterium]
MYVKRCLALIAPLALWMLASAPAHAELVSLGDGRYRDLQFVNGTALNSSSFQVDDVEDTVYTFTLTDLQFPNEFEQLAVAITDAAASFFSERLELAEGMNTATLDVTFEQPGVYVASVFATIAGQVTAVGLYSLDVEVSIIPVPPAVLLLASGLLAVGARRRFSRA